VMRRDGADRLVEVTARTGPLPLGRPIRGVVRRRYLALMNAVLT